MRFSPVLMVAAPLAAIATTAGARDVRTADYRFSYAYPASVARFPALKAWFDADAARRQASIAKDAADDRATSRKEGYPFHPYESVARWSMVTDTPRLLSLSADLNVYTGGAHGSPGSASLVWDKAGGRRLAPISLFTTPGSLQAAIRAPYCARLKVERNRRSGDTPEPADDLFAPCPTLKELTLLLGSTNGQRIDRIGLLADPYVAGSYAEGTYEVTLPVSPAVLAAVRPEWRSAFALGTGAR